jgi:hypothetical protein
LGNIVKIHCASSKLSYYVLFFLFNIDILSFYHVLEEWKNRLGKELDRFIPEGDWSLEWIPDIYLRVHLLGYAEKYVLDILQQYLSHLPYIVDVHLKWLDEYGFAITVEEALPHVIDHSPLEWPEILTRLHNFQAIFECHQLFLALLFRFVTLAFAAKG